MAQRGTSVTGPYTIIEEIQTAPVVELRRAHEKQDHRPWTRAVLTLHTRINSTDGGEILPAHSLCRQDSTVSDSIARTARHHSPFQAI